MSAFAFFIRLIDMICAVSVIVILNAFAVVRVLPVLCPSVLVIGMTCAVFEGSCDGLFAQCSCDRPFAIHLRSVCDRYDLYVVTLHARAIGVRVFLFLFCPPRL